MISYGSFKGRKAVIVMTERAIATFLPQDGGKLASLQSANDRWEFLAQAQQEEYRVLAYDGSYVDAQCDACDEMFPTIDPCKPVGFLPEYPDHGEVCRMEHQVRLDDSGVTFFVHSELLNYDYEKRVACDNNGAIVLQYAITNHNLHPMPYLWAMHCMLRGEDDAEVLLPFDASAPYQMMFGPDHAELLPKDRLIGYAPGEGATYKYYMTTPVSAGMCGYAYRSNGHLFRMEYDPKEIPFIGVWLNNGAFKDMYNVALEPCTSAFDTPTRAAENGCGRELLSGETIRFCIRIFVE